MLKLADVELMKIEGRLDNVEANIRKLIHGKKKNPGDLEETITESNKKDDGFDSLRELRKSGIS